MPISKDATWAERQRGCLWAEQFRSAQDVVAAGGTAVNNPRFGREGVDLVRASSQYIWYPDTDQFSFSNGTTDRPFSCTAWLFMRDATSFSILGRGDVVGVSEEYMWMTYTDDKMYLQLIDPSAGKSIGRITPALTQYENRWVHCAFTYSGSSTSAGIKLYVGGVQADNADNNVLPYTAMEPFRQKLRIGHIIALPADFPNGKIRSLKIWNVELTPQEVLDLAHNQTAGYRSKSLLSLPFGMAQHDISNVAGSAELLVDGDDEAVGVAAYTVGNAATLTKSIVTPYQGTQCLRVAFNGTTQPYGYQTIQTGGKWYRSTGWARGDGTYAPYVQDGAVVLWVGTTANVWQRYDVQYVATAATFRLYSAAAAAGYCEFDYCSTKQVIPRALDISGSGLNANFGDSTTLTSYPTKLTTRGMSFDSGDYLKTASISVLSGLSKCSFCAVVNLNSTIAAYAKIICKGNNATPPNARVVQLAVGGAGFGTTKDIMFEVDYDSDFSIGNTTTTPLNYGNVNTIVGVFDGAGALNADRMKIYVNGKEITGLTFTNTVPAALPVDTNPIYVGTYSVGLPSSSWNGSIFSVEIFNIAMSPTQVWDWHFASMAKLNKV